MDIKSTLKFAGCPLGKWKGLQITEDEYLEVKELLEITKVRISTIQQEQVKFYSEKYLGLRVNTTTCSPCVATNLNRLKQIVEEYEK